MASREHSLCHPVWGGREHEFLPLTSAKQVLASACGFTRLSCLETLIRVSIVDHFVRPVSMTKSSVCHALAIAAGFVSLVPSESVAAQSDSANLDNVAELMVRTGVDLEEALMVLVPEAYRNHPDLMANYPEARLGNLPFAPATIALLQTECGSERIVWMNPKLLQPVGGEAVPLRFCCR